MIGRSVWGRLLLPALALGFCVAEAKAQPISGNSVLYRGCLPADPAYCAELTFFEVAGSMAWHLAAPTMIRTPSLIYDIRDDMWTFRTADGSCAGAAPFQYLFPPSCAISRRLDIDWYAQAQYRTYNDPSYIGGAMLRFSYVAPEPATMWLLGGGLAGIAGTVRRRRQRRGGQRA